MPNENDLNNLNLEQQAQEQNTQIENKDDNVGGFDEVAFEQGLRKDEAKLSILQEEYNNVSDKLHDEFENTLEQNPKALFSDEELEILASDSNIASKNRMLRDRFEKFRDDKLNSKKEEISKFEELLQGKKSEFEIASQSNKFAKENPDIDMEDFAEFIQEDLTTRQKKELRDNSKTKYDFLVGAYEIYKKAKGVEQNEKDNNLPPDLNELNGASGTSTFDSEKERQEYLKSRERIMYLRENAKADDRWEIERDFETLVRASEISGDKERLKKVQEFAKKQKEAMDKVLDTEYLKSIGIGRD